MAMQTTYGVCRGSEIGVKTAVIPPKTSLYANSSKQWHKFVPSRKAVTEFKKDTFTRQAGILSRFSSVVAIWVSKASSKGWRNLKKPQQCRALGLELALPQEALVELAELPEEAVVGADLAVLPHGAERGSQVHVLPQHQVGNDQRGGAAVALPAVHQHLGILLGKCFVNKISCLLKIAAEVEFLSVVGFNAMVSDACAFIELCICVHMHEWFPLCCIQNMGYPQMLQPHNVLGYEPRCCARWAGCSSRFH